MPEIDAGPHATPDQVRAAEKRAAAAAAAIAADPDPDAETEARTAPPKRRSSKPQSTT